MVLKYKPYQKAKFLHNIGLNINKCMCTDINYLHKEEIDTSMFSN